jgi:actin-like ATPase involved in cell morphogenesis
LELPVLIPYSRLRRLAPEIVGRFHISWSLLIFSGGECGSVFIDGEFKRWLRGSIVGEEAYELLEPNTNGRIEAHSTTSEGMRAIIQQFARERKRFTGKESDSEVFGIDLPKQLRDVENEAVEEGELMIVR